MSFTVQLLPSGHTWRGDDPVDLVTAAADCDVLLDFPCGGRSSCGKCAVNVTHSGETHSQLGCQLTLHTDTIVELPETLPGVSLKGFGAPELFQDGFVPAMQLPPSGDAWGFAVDIGTTTLAGALVDLRTGVVARTISQLNPQIAFGADVMTRISFARESECGNRVLHERLMAAIGGMLAWLAECAAVAPSDIYGVALVGNSTMLHTAIGADVSSLGVAPFVGAMHGAWLGCPADLGLELHAYAQIYAAPVIASHVGSDTVANIIATSLDRAGSTRLLIDLGTNTELALAANGKLMVTSASGGPAFEGGCLHQGMRAIPGAIDHVRITSAGRIATHTVAHARPIGICGSGLLDAVAELLQAGVIEPSGRMRCEMEMEYEGKRSLAARIVEIGAHGRAFRLAGPADDLVVLTAADVRQLQLVKGSIGAAITLLLEHAAVGLDDVAEVLVAGAFGNCIRKDSALLTGVLPDIDPERVRLVGHTAGIGARMLLVDARARERAARIADRAEFLDLAGHIDFERHFVEALAYA